jgi:hypothetical protein
MPLALVFLLVLCVGLLVTFSTGQVVGKKVELTNAADAAAYSIAVEQARARNLAAYLNRGRVANEVAIAQMVSLNSWVTMIHSTSDNFGDFIDTAQDFLFWVPYVGQALTALDRAMQAVNQALKVFRKAEIPAVNLLITGLDQVMNHAYATTAKLALGDLGSTLNVQTMAGKVVEDNAPGAQLSILARGVLEKNVIAAGDQLDHFEPGQNKGGAGRTNTGGERYRNVVMASRDEFTRDRKTHGLFGFSSNGGTDMIEYDRWSGVDVHEFSFGVWPIFDIDFPLGWGGTQATNKSPRPKFFRGMNDGHGWRSPYDNHTYSAYNGVKKNSLSGKFIEDDPAVDDGGFQDKDAYLRGYKYGISHKYDDVKRGYSETPEGKGNKAGPIYTVEAAIKMEGARTSSELGMGVGRMQLKDEARCNDLRAMASAQVYFNRPYNYSPFKRVVWGRSDRKFEQGSMFSPYWQARLVETPLVDKAMLVGACVG